MVRSSASYIRQTLVFINLAELFPVPSDNNTMFLELAMASLPRVFGCGVRVGGTVLRRGADFNRNRLAVLVGRLRRSHSPR